MSEPAIRLAGVGVTYPNGTRALDGVDLEVTAGQRVALVGASGAGKSTLLNLLNGRVALDGAEVVGDVDVLGVDVARRRGRSRRRHGSRIAVVRQDHDLVGPLRVIHNVNAGRLGAWSTGRAVRSLIRPVDREVVGALLTAVGLAPDLADVRVDELSGGQRQRVALARMLRQQPEVVLADEPVASLDPTLSGQMLDLIASPPPACVAGGGWTAIVSLHQPEFAHRFADRVIGLRDGRIRFDVAVDALDDGLLDQVYGRS